MKLNRSIYRCITLLLLFSFTACLRTKLHHDSKAGENLGFEYFDNNLPVNWIIYDPKDLACKVTADTIVFCEGKQSLRFEILKSDDKEVVNYTGFTKEFMTSTKGAGLLELSFSVINEGTKFMIYANSTKAKSSGDRPILIEEKTSFHEWKRYKVMVNVPAEMWLRFEIKINGVGVFHIDDVKINQL
jgi:hypothetical protein